MPTCYFVAAQDHGRAARATCRCSSSRKARRASSVGRSLDKSGWLSSDTAELVFDNCRIPAANLLGEEDKGFYSMMKNFQTERIALAAMAVGHATQALRMTLDFVRQRQAFGASLFDKQVVRQRLGMLDARPAPRGPSCITAPGA